MLIIAMLEIKTLIAFYQKMLITKILMQILDDKITQKLRFFVFKNLKIQNGLIYWIRFIVHFYKHWLINYFIKINLLSWIFNQRIKTKMFLFNCLKSIFVILNYSFAQHNSTHAGSKIVLSILPLLIVFWTFIMTIVVNVLGAFLLPGHNKRPCFVNLNVFKFSNRGRMFQWRPQMFYDA